MNFTLFHPISPRNGETPQAVKNVKTVKNVKQVKKVKKVKNVKKVKQVKHPKNMEKYVVAGFHRYGVKWGETT